MTIPAVEPAGVSEQELRDDIAELKVRVERCIESWGSAPAALQKNLAMREEILAARQQLADERKETVKLEHWLLRKDEQLAEMRRERDELLVSLGRQILKNAKEAAGKMLGELTQCDGEESYE